MHILISAINSFAQIIELLLVGRAISSWFVRGGTGSKVYQTFVTLTEPIVAPCRKLTSRYNTGMLDLSVLLAFFLVMIARDVLIRILMAFA